MVSKQLKIVTLVERTEYAGADSVAMKGFCFCAGMLNVSPLSQQFPCPQVRHLVSLWRVSFFKAESGKGNSHLQIYPSLPKKDWISPLRTRWLFFPPLSILEDAILLSTTMVAGFLSSSLGSQLQTQLLMSWYFSPRNQYNPRDENCCLSYEQHSFLLSLPLHCLHEFKLLAEWMQLVFSVTEESGLKGGV